MVPVQGRVHQFPAGNHVPCTNTFLSVVCYGEIRSNNGVAEWNIPIATANLTLVSEITTLVTCIKWFEDTSVLSTHDNQLPNWVYFFCNAISPFHEEQIKCNLAKSGGNSRYIRSSNLNRTPIPIPTCSRVIKVRNFLLRGNSYVSNESSIEV